MRKLKPESFIDKTGSLTYYNCTRKLLSGRTGDTKPIRV